MLRKLRSYLRNTRLRYIISYMLITALLIGAIGIYMYTYYSKSVYDTTLSGEKGIMYQVKYLCDGYMNMLESGVMRLESAGPERLSDTLSLIRVTGDGNEIIRLSDDLNDLEFEDSDIFDFSTLTETTVLPSQQITTIGVSESYVAFISPLNVSDSNLVCLIPESSFRLVTESEDATIRNRYVLYNGTIVASAEGFPLEDSQIARTALTGENTNERKRINGRDYVITALPGAHEGVAYVSAVNLNRIRTSAAGMWLSFAAFMFLIAIPCMGFMWYISKQNLKPLLELSKRFGESNGDEISAIDKGIKDLEGENAVLAEIVTDSLPARRHLFVKQLVSGVSFSRKEAIAAGTELGISAGKAFCSVILTGLPKDDSSFTTDMLTGLAPEGVSAAGMDMVESKQILLIGFSDDRHGLDEFAKAVSAAAPEGVPVSVSNAHDSLDELPGAFLEAGAAYESRFIMGSARLLRFENIPVTSGKSRINASKYSERIKVALREADNEALESCLNEIMIYLKGGDMTLFQFRQFYNDIISAIAAEAGEDFTPEMYDLFTLTECGSVDELDDILRSICGKIITVRTQTERVPMTQAVLKTLTDNYTDSEFSIAGIAESIGISNAKLLQEFKAETGMTPTDYLTMLRMEQAKKLLTDTDLPVRDIASGSGYSDASSFTRRFKLYTGTTPLQYRQNARTLDT